MASNASSAARRQGGNLASSSVGIRARLGAPFAQRCAANTASIEAVFKQALGSGKLMLSSRNLEHAPLQAFLDAASSGMDGMNFWDVVDLAVLDLSHNNIRELSAQELGSLRSLEVLNLNSNPITASGVPFEALGRLEMLKSLNLANTGQEGAFPEHVANCRRLVELVLNGNRVTRLPECMEFLEALEILACANNMLTSLPTNMPMKLLRIDLTDNKLTELPDSFASLVHLESLELSKNRITRVDCLSPLSSLKMLNLRQNALTQLPPLPSGKIDTVLLGLNKIKTINTGHLMPCAGTLTLLDLSGNKLVSVPGELGCFGRLKSLDLMNNDLNALPPSIGWLTSLDRFNVNGNAIRTIRRSIIDQGTEALKKYLRSRGPKHELLPERWAMVDDIDAVAPATAGQLGKAKKIASFERMFD